MNTESLLYMAAHEIERVLAAFADEVEKWHDQDLAANEDAFERTLAEAFKSGVATRRVRAANVRKIEAPAVPIAAEEPYDRSQPCACVPCPRHDSIDEQAYRNANLKQAVEEKRLAREQAKKTPVEDFGPEPDWSVEPTITIGEVEDVEQ